MKVEHPIPAQLGRYVTRLDRPESGYIAVFGALVYRDAESRDCRLCTPVQVHGGRRIAEF